MNVRQFRLSFIAAAMACGGSTDPDPASNPPATVTNLPGTTNRTLSVDGQERAFVVHVGSSVGATTAAPVVFMFHGTSGDGPQFYNISGWKEQADREGLIAVFPSALTYCFYEDENRDGDFDDAGERKLTSKWTHGKLGDPTEMPLCTASVIASLPAPARALADHPLRDDVAFVDAMIAFLKQNYVIDQKAIYSTGFSNGAQFSNRLAVERNQVFAATAAHAGGTSVSPSPGRAISVVSSVGTLDDRFTVPLGVTEIPLGESTLTDLPVLAGIMIAPLLQQLRLTEAHTYDELTVAGKKVARWVFRTSTVGANNSLTFTLWEDLFHQYPNGSNYPATFANVLWTVFKAQRLP
jgi:polyhydroxybutyrate depolymerase